MSKVDTQEYKHRIREYLEHKGIDLDTRAKPPLIRCLIPGHEDKHPSAVVYEDKVWCPVCGESYDIFKAAGYLIGTDNFKEQLKEVQGTFGVSTDYYDNKPVPVKPEDKEKIFSDKNFDWFLKDKKDCNITGKWFYYNQYGDIDLIDIRIEYLSDKKNRRIKEVVSFYYNGKHLKAKNYPILIYNRNLLEQNKTKPVLVVEGCKCAEAAESLEDFIPITWNGGCKKCKLPDWSILKNRQVYIWPDDDDPGIQAAFEIKKILVKHKAKVKILNPQPELKTLKEKGADIIEAFQLFSIEDINKYIIESKDLIPESSKEEKTGSNTAAPDGLNIPSDVGRSGIANKKKLDFTFKILGVADDGKAYFIDRSERLQRFQLCGISKPHLLMLAPRAWWIMSEFGNGESKVYWDMAIDSIIHLSNQIDFDSNKLRGRGAWTDNKKLIYNDGKKIYGNISQDVIYLRKKQEDIGLGEDPLPYEDRKKIKDIVFKLSFETKTDAIRCLSWTSLAPFGGCLPWRPAILITGPSGSGKTTVANNIIRRISNSVWLDGSESTPAGVRGIVQNDTCSVVFEEAETDTKKKKENRLALFSLMRTNTSDDSPDVAKGTTDGGVRNYKMRNMFCFLAISPEIDNVADENRIFKVSFRKPEGDKWTDLQKEINSILTVDNCRRLRSFIWSKLEKIIDDIELLIPIIQEITEKDYRYCYAEGLLLSAFFNIYSDREFTQDYLEKALDQFYKWQPISDTRDETEEILDKLFDFIVPVTTYSDKQTLREIIQMVYTGKEITTGYEGEIESDIESKKLLFMKQILHRYGIDVNKEGEIAIANNHNEIMSIIEKGHGYHIQLCRHKNCIDKSRVVTIAKKSRRCVILKDILEITEKVYDINNEEVPF